MAMTVHCDIVSAEGEIFSGLVEMVIAHGNLGDLGIALGHAPLITDLKPGPIRLVMAGGETEVYYISGGFLEVQPNMIKVLADTVQRAADLDEASAQEAVKAAEKALHEK
ncbi:MAG: F0F1 ATP synthase subunit epsilon, partial [Pseudomonas sp.]|uniref:F0F1 ATP synthase subunit epsilon n=1 Tax=Pseudomonas sp. TaxID=306 RepID=UPI003BB659DB